MQDVCHTNFVIDLAHGGVCGSVIEDRSAESEGLRFDSSWNFLCPKLETRGKTSFSISLPSSNLTVFHILFTNFPIRNLIQKVAFSNNTLLIVDLMLRFTQSSGVSTLTCQTRDSVPDWRAELVP